MHENLSRLKTLVNDFQIRIKDYKNPNYNEENVRSDFIDQFFAVLGWDMWNKNALKQGYRDIEREDRVLVKGKPKAPDYSFKVNREKRAFFVEAKKPAVFVKEAIDPAYQVRSYGFSADLDISILTDFEEFSVYDTRIKPKPTDKAGVARIFYCTYDEYEKNFEFLYKIFSKESVIKGSIAEYIKADKKVKGTSAIDKEFLKDIEEWREKLAKNIAINNSKLSVSELNFAVQKIIDRIIFLRITEDRGIEDYENLLKLIKDTKKIYLTLNDYFIKANKKYNSELFRREEYIENLKIDNEIFENIINNIYFPKCPYIFSEIPIEILGNIYEQFLGKTIHFTPSHNAKIEEKPEVRKAGGVYYTPQYIVDYIVKNTVGEKIKDKTPEEIEKLKILDPACGSGSFLIGAYHYLLDHHLDYYIKEKNIAKALKTGIIYQAGDTYYLAIKEKQKILLNNIHGVDIDRQAVEVTKLSLMLKLLEGEGQESAGQFFKFSDVKMLPDLSKNIKCGNSLVGPDFYEDKNISMFPNEDMEKINVFNWNSKDKGFGEIMTGGGFDCVIGNPPYVRQEMLIEYKEYFSKKYQVYDGVADLYVYFFEKGISLLNPNGVFGIIVANKWLRTKYGANLRKYLKKQGFKEIIDFGDLPVFQGATTYPCITIIQNKYKSEKIFATEVKTLEYKLLTEYVRNNQSLVNKESLQDDGWFLINESEQILLKKLFDKGKKLDVYVNGKFFRGIVTGFNDAFVIDESTKNKLIKEDISSKELIKPFIAGREVKRYQCLEPDKYLIFTRRGIDIKKYPAIEKHLLEFKDLLMPKPKDWSRKEWKGRKPGSYKWYEIQDSIDYYEEFEKPKLIYPNICKRNEFTYDNQKLYTNQKCFILSIDDKYLLGILNSSVIYFLFKKILPKLRGDFYEPGYAFLKDFPIPENVDDLKKAKVTDLANQLLILHKQLGHENNDTNTKQLNQKIDIIDNQIDKLVYELYELTKEEIKIIEENVK